MQLGIFNYNSLEKLLESKDVQFVFVNGGHATTALEKTTNAAAIAVQRAIESTQSGKKVLLVSADESEDGSGSRHLGELLGMTRPTHTEAHALDGADVETMIGHTPQPVPGFPHLDVMIIDNNQAYHDVVQDFKGFAHDLLEVENAMDETKKAGGELR